MLNLPSIHIVLNLLPSMVIIIMPNESHFHNVNQMTLEVAEWFLTPLAVVGIACPLVVLCICLHKKRKASSGQVLSRAPSPQMSGSQMMPLEAVEGQQSPMPLQQTYSPQCPERSSDDGSGTWVLVIFIVAVCVICCVCPLFAQFCNRTAPPTIPIPQMDAGQMVPLAAAGVAVAAAGATIAAQRGQQQQQQYYPPQYPGQQPPIPVSQTYPPQYHGGQQPPMPLPQSYPPQYPGQQPPMPYDPLYPGPPPVPGYPPATSHAPPDQDESPEGSP